MLCFCLPLYVFAQSDIVKIDDGVVWANKDKCTKIYLIGRGYQTDELRIESEEDFKVFYRTCINSQEDIVEELKPKKTEDNVTYYDLKHRFSRTTIWMAIEIRKHGKRDNELTKTFYGSINKSVPNGSYW